MYRLLASVEIAGVYMLFCRHWDLWFERFFVVSVNKNGYLGNVCGVGL